MKIKKYNLFQIICLVFILENSVLQPSFADFRDINIEECPVDKNAFKRVLHDVRNKKPNVLASLSNCLRTNHKLVFQACLIDPAQLEGAAEMFRSDENFALRLIKIYPETLLYVANDLRKDEIFVEKATYINRDALKYADPKLLDNKIFMKRMIKNDSRNYIYASNRIKQNKEHASLAFEDDGLLIMYAPDEIRGNKKLAKIALESNVAAFDSLGYDLQQDKEIRVFVAKRAPIDKRDFERFLQKTYTKIDNRKNIAMVLNKEARLHKDNVVIEKKYITKWQRNLHLRDYHLQEESSLIPAESRNYPTLWKEDLKDYPDLIEKIEKFFMKRFVDEESIENMALNYLWKVKDDPLTLAFDLYLLSKTNDEELGSEYASVISMTAIAQKISEKDWRLSVMDVNFGNETKMDIAFENAHKRYDLQDLYFKNDQDKNPLVIFRVEDKFEEYFEVFAQTKGNKYRLNYRIDPLKITRKPYYEEEDFFGIKLTREEKEEQEWLQMIEKCSQNSKCANRK
ncbi:MAG TPA: DUF4116 domain-containing protein [Rickettsiales bacterium]|nr:DUF4116 domain-containing protein [Rickettsiales bacterium]